MERRGPSHLGPYGQACMSCFKSKCKCVARPDGPGCQRCHRLKKPCRPSDSTQRHTIRKKESDARIAQLEKKVDGLISRLETRGVLDRSAGHDDTIANQATEPLDLEISVVVPSGPAATAHELHQSHLQEEQQPYCSDESTEEFLRRFRTDMLPRFPFVHLPPEVTSDTLSAWRPLLLRAIVYVSSRNRGAAGGDELRRELSDACLKDDTNRVDLLLALLTYLSWGWDHSILLPRLMSQAISIAHELRSHNIQGSMDTSRLRAILQPGRHEADPESSRQSNFLEHHRALLGCFILSSAVSLYHNHSFDALRWSPEMGEGLSALGSSSDCPTDATFVLLVRLQLLVQKSIHIRRQQQEDQPAQGADSVDIASTTATAMSQIESLREDLQDLRTSILGMATDDAGHLSHVYVADLLINQAAYAVSSTVPYIVSFFSALTARGNPPRSSERMGHLWKCIDASSACIDNLLLLSASSFYTMPLIQWSNMVTSLVVLCHLSYSSEDPLLDQTAVRDVADVPGLLERVAGKLVVPSKDKERNFLFRQMRDRLHTLCADLRAGTELQKDRARKSSDSESAVPHSNARDLFHVPVSSYVP